jgi:very-short-patch-repair endonuclease
VGEGQGRGPQTLANAKSLRSNQTEAEARLWYHLRAHRFMGLQAAKTRRPLHRGFRVLGAAADHRARWWSASEQAAYDQQRDAWLRSQGYTVLRFWNNDVMPQLDGVLEQIRCAVSPESSPRE